MTTIRRFCCDDLLRFSPVNLDHLTETVSFVKPPIPQLSASLLSLISNSLAYCLLVSVQFNMSFYMTYLARWPDYFHVAEAPGNRIMGYSKSLTYVLFSRISVSLGLVLLTNFDQRWHQLCKCLIVIVYWLVWKKDHVFFFF